MNLYADYTDFKGWGDSALPHDRADFEFLVAAAGKAGHLDLIDFGFGGGELLDWAAGKGHRAIGIEQIEQSVSAARNRGHEAYLGSHELPGEKAFDLIMALDVLEHLDEDAMAEFFSLADRSLRPDGAIVARFPNGDSPFFGRFQHGDYTHLKPLTAAALGQLARRHGFEVVSRLNPRPRASGVAARLKRLIAYAIRDIVEIVIGFVYFGSRTPLDPNVVAILARRPARQSERHY